MVSRRRLAFAAWMIAPLVALSGCAGVTGVATDQPVSAEGARDKAGQGDGPSRGAQVVKVKKHDLSFELPKGWTTLDAKNLLDASNPVIKEVASRMGMTPRQLADTMGRSVLTFSITDKGAVRGFVDNVNSVGLSRSEFSDDRITMQLATIGAKPGKFEHATSAAGDVIRVPYRWRVARKTIHGVLVMVDVGDAAAQITVSSHAAGKARKLADQIQASLRPIG